MQFAQLDFAVKSRGEGLDDPGAKNRFGACDDDANSNSQGNYQNAKEHEYPSPSPKEGAARLRRSLIPGGIVRRRFGEQAPLLYRQDEAGNQVFPVGYRTVPVKSHM
jgi:hypothetical protein